MRISQLAVAMRICSQLLPHVAQRFPALAEFIQTVANIPDLRFVAGVAGAVVARTVVTRAVVTMLRRPNFSAHLPPLPINVFDAARHVVASSIPAARAGSVSCSM